MSLLHVASTEAVYVGSPVIPEVKLRDLLYRFSPPIPGAQALECRSGKDEALRKVSSLPLEWTTSWETCKIGEGCQETVLLIVNGETGALVCDRPLLAQPCPRSSAWNSRGHAPRAQSPPTISPPAGRPPPRGTTSHHDPRHPDPPGLPLSFQDPM